MGSYLMCNEAAVCGGGIYLKIVVRDLSERCEYLESESVMTFPCSLACWEYRDTSLVDMVHPIYIETMSWGSSSTGSNETLRIHPRELELYVKVKMCDPCPSCWMVT